MTIEGMGGDDHIFAGSGDIDSNLDGNVTVDGGAGTNELILEDSLDPAGADSDTLTDSTFDKTNYVGALDFASIQRLTLNANPFDNTIAIDSTGVDTEVVVNGNNGADAFEVNASPLSQITVNGGNPLISPGDRLRVIGSPISHGQYRPIGDGTANGPGRPAAARRFVGPTRCTKAH